MKTGKLALLATLVVALFFGGALPSAAAVESAPAIAPPAVTDDMAGQQLTEVVDEAVKDATETAQTPNSEIPEPSAEPQQPALSVPPADMTEPYPEESLTDSDEDYDPVIGHGFPVPGPNTPMVTDADGTVRSTVGADPESAVASAGSALSRSPQAARGGGTIEVHLLLTTLADNGRKVAERDALAAVEAANEYWRTMSNGAMTFKVTYTAPHRSSARSTDNYPDVMNTVSREVGWKNRANTVLLVYVGAGELMLNGSGGLLGGGWPAPNNSGRILMPAPSGFSKNVMAHEVGHVLGFMHANSLRCPNGQSDASRSGAYSWSGGCTSFEYGDTTDLMGFAQFNLPAISAYYWDMGGMGSGNEIRKAAPLGNEPQTFTLRPWAGTAQNRAVRFTDPGSGETYYVELRQPAGYDTHLASGPGGNRGVKITKADLVTFGVSSLVIPPSTRGFPGSYNSAHTWQVGQTFRTHAGATVTVNWMDQNGASVTIAGGSAARAKEAIDAARAAHPELGRAVTDIAGGLGGGGFGQSFESGVIYWSPSTQASVLRGANLTAYAQQGYERGRLGYPIGDEYGTSGGAVQRFQGGWIVWSAGHGSRYLLGSIGDRYMTWGGPQGQLGFPTGNETALSTGAGASQNFQNGAIYWSPASGTAMSTGAIRRAYATMGYETGRLGYPTSNEYAVAGGVIQDYQGGRIAWSAATGNQYLFGGIGNRYLALGGPGGSGLGFPRAAETSFGPGGVAQEFERGTIVWSASTGAHSVKNGDMRDAYTAAGSHSGRLQFPVSEQYNVAGGQMQDFRGGRIIRSDTTGTRYLYGSIGNLYLAWGGPVGQLGFPIGEETSLKTGAGAVQKFQHGSIYWSQASGTAVSAGAIRNAYAVQGYELGRLGYPTSNEYVVAAGGVQQDYQGGRIIWSPQQGAHFLFGSIGNLYLAWGGSAGQLGFPVGEETSLNSGGGASQAFQNGTIYWSPAAGTFVSAGAIRKAYAAQGFETGRLGYPVSNEYQAGSGYMQDYQGGWIAWSPATGSVSLFGAIGSAYAVRGGPSSFLGFPLSPEKHLGGSKYAQDFQGGTIMWSPLEGTSIIRS